MAIATSPKVSIGPPLIVLRDRTDGTRISGYDVSPDGRRVLLWKPVAAQPDEGQRLVLIQNALAAKRR